MIGNIYILVIGTMLGVFFIVFLMILLQVRSQSRILWQKKILAERETAHQKELARIFIVSQENERRRIGMDLHDEVGTVLSALRMHLEKMADPGNKERIAELNATGKRSIDNIINNVRKISHDLSPFMKGAYELRDGIEDLTDQVGTSNGLPILVDFNNIETFGFLPPDTQLALYRIVSELMNNTIKHAGATAADLRFVRTGTILMVTYKDNGKGMANVDTGKKGIGMANIESRCNTMGATYRIEENKGTGFAIEIKIPTAANS